MQWVQLSAIADDRHEEDIQIEMFIWIIGRTYVLWAFRRQKESFAASTVYCTRSVASCLRIFVPSSNTSAIRRYEFSLAAVQICLAITGDTGSAFKAAPGSSSVQFFESCPRNVRRFQSFHCVQAEQQQQLKSYFHGVSNCKSAMQLLSSDFSH